MLGDIEMQDDLYRIGGGGRWLRPAVQYSCVICVLDVCHILTIHNAYVIVHVHVVNISSSGNISGYCLELFTIM